MEQNEKRIFCVEYLPDESKNINHGVILCKPIWGERIRTHRIFTNLARVLKGNGFTVITCDYFGDGNSAGDTLDLNFSGMAEDIRALYTYLAETYQLQKFTMVGLRIGANCAIEAAKSMHEVVKMILVETVLDLVSYLKRALRSNLSTQMAAYKKIIKNREMLIKDIKNEIPVNMDGFLIGKSLWESFENFSPLRVDTDFKGEVLFLALAEEGKKFADHSKSASEYENGRFENIDREFIWTDWKKNVQKPPIFISKILNEIVTTQPKVENQNE